MHIKSLAIHGFKSFRDTVHVTSLSAGENIVVGRNGSGKSNFFSAIRFVLGDAYTSLSREERQALLYDASGATTATLSAYVELVLDNGDGRFPLSGAEVVLRRTVSLAKDEYMVDRRAATKSDVANLLESAGFSRSNPFYIVPQGRITHLTNASDADRLALLKDVAGTRMYEERRGESLELLRTTDARYDGTAELLQQIDTRIAELGREQSELKKFYKRDNERRCLEYTIYQRELADVAEMLDALEAERRREVDASNARRAEFAQQDDAVAAHERDLVAAQQQVEQLALDQTQLEQERRDLTRQRAQLESSLEDRQEDAGRDELQAQVDALAAQIASKDSALHAQSSEQRAVLARLGDARTEYEQTRARIAALYEKQARARQFASAAERDAALAAELARLDADDAAQEAPRAAAEDAVRAGDTQLAELGARRSALEAQTATRSETLAQLGAEWRARRAQRDELGEEKKELWKQEAKTNAALMHARDQLHTAQRALSGTMDRATASGIQAVQRIAQREQLAGVYGPLYELFSVDERYKTAVEATAGASLFHIVVDTDATASALLEHLGRERSGRVTFMPLNRLRPGDTQYPQAQDAVVLLRKLVFDAALRPAFQQVFGKTIVCPRLDIAAAYVRSYAVNAITLSGDQVNRRGTLSGGFHDPRRSRLDAVGAVQRWLADVATHEGALHETSARLSALEQQITQLHSDEFALEARRQQLHDARVPELDEVTWLRREEADVRSRLARLHQQIADDAASAAARGARRTALRAELGAPLAPALDVGEAAELERLVGAESAARTSLASLARHAVALTDATGALRMEIDERLLRTQGDVAGRLEALSDPPQARAEGASADALRMRMAANAERLAATQAQSDAVSRTTAELHTKLEAVRGAHSEQASEAARQHKLAERFAAKRQRLLEQRARCNQQIRDLGVLPEDAFEAYTQRTGDELVAQLQRARAALDEVAHVNKRAVEQYATFTKQRDTLLQRHADLNASQASIHELVAVLDARKSDALEWTLDQVGRHFSELFAALVPGGRGRLVVERGTDRVPAGSDASAPPAPDAQCTGVAIEVSFSPMQREGLRIHQLSGGQKTLVALATVFAIQKCDPAPFYLFDEVDANLDTQYRTSVAALIHTLAKDAQFIITTFRPELVDRADRCFGVLFNAQKVSSVVEITRAEAHAFVEATET
ncbi:Structural maintenance of chromosomes protein 3 [Malassezia sp. CBS 17886]|nr:Structural maintenance of chromosomes protein 3 [Malassezia sp. CBS 17886]